MLLVHRFNDPQLNFVLELLLRSLVEFFGERLVSVLLYGSVLFDDLAPGYGDLDFLAVVDGELDKETCDQLRRGCPDTRRHGSGGTLHSVDWLLMAARCLLWLKEGRFSGKSEAADWASVNAKGEWRSLLPRAKEIRLNPALAESPGVRRWLDGLTGPIREAADELESELRAHL